MNLNLVTFLDNFTIIEWVKAIEQLPKKNKDNNLIKTAIVSKGFDSQFNTKEIESRYNLLMK